MARAGADAPSPTLMLVVGVNLGCLVLAVLTLSPAALRPTLAGVIAALVVPGAWAAHWLWRRPWRRPLMVVSCGLGLFMGLSAGLLGRALPASEDRSAVALTLATGCMLLLAGLWFLTVWRAHQIEARLAAQAERERAIEMAQRLASAQLAPHFLFNTLASVQHWVQTRDDRAAPLLAALTGYLRATLPMFNRPRLALADELLAVERYLQVMQARMGPRLAWQIDVEPALLALQLPPGVMLTLVENAIVHGLEPALAGGRVQLRGRLQDGQAHLEVIDDGPGPPPALQEGVGLGNVRQRLQLTCGPAAQLTLGPAPGGGFRAHLQLPLADSP